MVFVDFDSRRRLNCLLGSAKPKFEELQYDITGMRKCSREQPTVCKDVAVRICIQESVNQRLSVSKKELLTACLIHVGKI